jgi:hypothetical protein
MPSAAALADLAEPNWVVLTLLGGLAGAIVTPLATLLWWGVRRVRPHPMCGVWHSYHMTFRQNRAVMLSGQYRIRRGFRSPLVVSAVNSANDHMGTPVKTLSYRGRLEHEGGHYVMDLSGRSHQEHLMIRFAERIPPNDKMLSGIWLAYDHDNQVASGVQLFSRDKLSDDEALGALRGWILVDRGGVMRLRGAPRPLRAGPEAAPVPPAEPPL